MGCCDGLFKFFMFVVNFIFFVAGCCIVGLGAYLNIEMKDYFDFLSLSDKAGGVDVGSYVFIGVGVLVALIAFLGCCAACTENKCMMYSFGTLMTLILIAEIGVTIALLMYKGEAKEVVKDAMNKGMENYGEKEQEGVTRTWDIIQKQYNCCGVETPADWKNAAAWLKDHQNSLPQSCCKNPSAGCGDGQLHNPGPNINKEGCFNDFEDFVETNVLLVGGVGIGIILFQLIAVITACCLGKKMGVEKFSGV